MVSTIVADWSREVPRKFCDPSRKLLQSIRHYQVSKKKSGSIPLFLSKICFVEREFCSVITCAERPINSQLGGVLCISCRNEMVIDPEAIIGAHLDIGEGANIFGNISIDDNAVEAGIPAKVISFMQSKDSYHDV